jgi:hypothetical protein
VERLLTISDKTDDPVYLGLHQPGGLAWTIDCYLGMPTLADEQFEVYCVSTDSVEYPVACPLNWLLA